MYISKVTLSMEKVKPLELDLSTNTFLIRYSLEKTQTLNTTVRLFMIRWNLKKNLDMRSILSSTRHCIQVFTSISTR